MSNFFQDTWNGIKEIGGEAGSAIGHTIINADFNGAATTFSTKSKDQLSAVIDRSPASNSTDLMELTLEMTVAGYCKFNEKMRTYMNRLMKINVDQLSKTLGNTGKGAYMYGDSATISNEVKSYSYAKSVNYVDSFAKKAMIDRKGKSDSTVTKTEYTKEYPYEERTNLYPDDLEQGHSNFRQWEKWNVSNKNSILYKTKKLFEQRKINTIISRFGTNADGSSHGVDYIGSVRTKFGESRGRNLLKAEAEDYRVLNWSYAVNGYNNPYCRVWTHHHQYNYWTRTMRPFSTETLSQAGDGIFSAKMISPGEFHKWKTFQKESSNSAYRTYKGGDEGREYSVLDTSRGGDGLVKITPKYQGGEAKNIHTKDCMFSIENLAWRGYDPYAFENALSWEQRGPLGGRIMWFPPYGIQFSESTNVKWSSNTFIGRGEDVYTYINTSRAGTLSFLMVVDHPSIINYAMWNNGLDKQHSETDLLRFFAGCDSLNPDDPHSIMSKIQPTPLTDEWIKNGVDDPDDVIYQARQNTDQGAIYAYSGESKVILNKYVALFFPNNFTGKDAENDDNKLMQVLFYLFAGKGRGYFGTYKSEIHLPPDGLMAYNELFKVIKSARKDGNDESHYGYQMKHGILTTDSKGISDITDKRKDERSSGYFYVWVDEAKKSNTLRIIGNEKNDKKMSGGDWVTFGVNENLSNNNKFAIKINESQTIPSSEILTLYELLEMWSGDYKVGEGGLNLNSNTERVEITPLAGFESWWSTDKDNYPLPAYRLNTLTSALNKIFSQIKTDDSKQIYVTENPQKDSYRWMYDNKYTDTEAILKIAMHNSIEAILNRSAICQIKCYSKGDKKYYLTSASSRSVQENVMKGYNVTIEDVIRKIYYEVSLPSVQGGNDKAVMWELKPINEIIVSLMSSWPLNEYTDKANEIVFGENDDFIVEGYRVTSLKVNNNECAFVVDTSAQGDEGTGVTEDEDPHQTEDNLFWYRTKQVDKELQLQICAPVPLTIGVVNHLLSSTSMEDGSVHTVVVGETTIKYVYHKDATSYCIYNNNELLYTVDDHNIIVDSSSKRIVFTDITFGELEKGERTLMSDSTYKYLISTKNYKKGEDYKTNKEYDELSEPEKAGFGELKGEDSVLIIRRVKVTRNNISGNTNEPVNNTETNTVIPRTTNQVGLLSDSSLVDFKWLLALFARAFEKSEKLVYGMWDFVEEYYSNNDINKVMEWLADHDEEFYNDIGSIEKDTNRGFIIEMKDYNYIVKTTDDHEFCLDSIKISRTHSDDAAYYTIQYIMRCNCDTSTADKLKASIDALKTLCDKYKTQTTGLNTDVEYSNSYYYVTFKITCQWITDKIFNGIRQVQNLCLVMLNNLGDDVKKDFIYIPFYDIRVDNNKILIEDDSEIDLLAIFSEVEDQKIYYNGGWHSVSLTKTDKYVLELSDNGGSSEDTPSDEASPTTMTVSYFMGKCFERHECDNKDIFLPLYVVGQYGKSEMSGWISINSDYFTETDGVSKQYGGKCYILSNNALILQSDDKTFNIRKIEIYTYQETPKDVARPHILLYTDNPTDLFNAINNVCKTNEFKNLKVFYDYNVEKGYVIMNVTCIMSNFKDNQHKNDVVYLRDKDGNDCWGYTTDKKLSKKNKCYLIEDNELFGDKTSAQISDGVFFVKYVDNDTTYIQFQDKPQQTDDEGRESSENDQGTPKGKQDPSNTKKDDVNGMGDNQGNPGGDNGCVYPAKQTRNDNPPVTNNSGKPDENGVDVMDDAAPSPVPEEPVTNYSISATGSDVVFDIDKDTLPHNTPFAIERGRTLEGKVSDNIIGLYGGAEYEKSDLENLAKKLKNNPSSVKSLFQITFEVEGKTYRPHEMTTYQMPNYNNAEVYIDDNGFLFCGIKFNVTDTNGNLIESAVFNDNVKSLQMYSGDDYIYAMIQINPPESYLDEAVVVSASPGSGVRRTPIDRNNKCAFCVDESGRKHRGNEKNVFRYDQEYYFFKALQMTDKLAYTQLVEKIRYFDPAFHSMTPEGFNARLTFLNQCTRQGMTKSASDYNVQTANNMAFGRPPFCVLRMGDFYNQMIVIDSINIDYSVSEGIQWDMNTEGIGMQPLLARVDINFKFIGGGDIQGPIRRLQNAMTFNYYANTRFYDNRADRVRYGESTYDYKAMGAIDYSVNYNDSMSYVTKMRNKN